MLVYALFLGLPLLAVLLDGLASLLDFPISWSSFWAVLAAPLSNSLLISGASALLASGLGLALALGIYHLAESHPRRSRIIERGIFLLLGLSPVALSLGYYLFFREFLDLHWWAHFIIISIHSVTSVPFSFRVLLPAVVNIKTRCRTFKEVVGLSERQGFLSLELPALLSVIVAAFVACFALSLGNISVVAMFSQTGVETLPLFIYRLMGAYRFPEAAVLSAGLALFSLVILMLGVRLQRGLSNLFRW